MGSGESKKTQSTQWRLFAAVLVTVGAILFVFFQRQVIIDSINAVSSASVFYVMAATLAVASTVIFAAAGIYTLRLRKNLSYINVLIVQTATLFLGRITPASVGGVAAMGRMLYTQGHSTIQAATVIGMSGLATFFGNISLTGLALIFSNDSVTVNEINFPSIVWVSLGLVGLVFVVALFMPVSQRHLKNTFSKVGKTLVRYKNRKIDIIKAIIFGSLVTYGFSLAMIFAADSIGVSLSLVEAIIAVSLGSLGVAATPLPGGVVGAEAAIAATLTSFGVEADQAIATAFVYRFVIFWLPLLPGYLASQYALKKKLL